MFNVLNRFISRLDSDVSHSNSNHEEFGFQVLRNTNTDLAIEPWFDFIVCINGRMIDNPDHSLFVREVYNCAGNSVLLGLWSAKGQRTRTLYVPVQADNPALGLTLQWTPVSIASNIWHILDVPIRSPADSANLLPYSDYIIGSPDGILCSEISLGELVETHIGRALRLYVYNNEYDVTREVTIYPSREWGGNGALGCVLGYGALHRLPAPLSEPIAGPGETLFEMKSSQYPNINASPDTKGAEETEFPMVSDSSTFLVPAHLASSQLPITPAKKRDKRLGNGSNTAFIDDYFLEGESKSREEDHAPRAKSNIPPPPKAGGPS